MARAQSLALTELLEEMNKIFNLLNFQDRSGNLTCISYTNEAPEKRHW